MQIITGKYRARKLVAVEGDSTRPTLARVKESIFNLIQGKVQGSKVLDLFAGSGAFGAECISRSAEEVCFVDQEQKAINAIKTNTKKMSENFRIIKSDYLSALSKLSSENKTFDIIYLDPPYKSDFAITALQKIYELKLLNDEGIIVVEHESENDLLKLPSYYIIEKTRKYGIAYVDILRMKEEK